MSKNNYITESDIKNGIEKGKYREEGTVIRNIENGQIVKIIPKSEESSNYIPATFIQVNNNIVYYTDTSSIIKAMIDCKNQQLLETIDCQNQQIFDKLAEKYNIVLNSFKSYQTYGNDINILYHKCLDISTSFNYKIIKYAKGITIESVDSDNNIDSFMNSLDAYIKLLFIYIFITYSLHKEKFKNDVVIIEKIQAIQICIRELYEQLIVKSAHNKEGKCSIPNIDNSLYSMYIFNDEYDIFELERMVKQDTRFENSLSVIDFYKRLRKNNTQEERSHYSQTSFTYQKYFIKQNNIQVDNYLIQKDSNRYKLTIKLMHILEDLDKLKHIHNEIINIDSGDTEIFNIINGTLQKI